MRLLEYKRNMVVKPDDGQTRTQSFYDHWNEKGFLTRQKITDLVNYISAKESISFGEAVVALEDTYFYQLMNEYPQILEENVDFWYECYGVENGCSCQFGDNIVDTIRFYGIKYYCNMCDFAQLIEMRRKIK